MACNRTLSVAFSAAWIPPFAGQARTIPQTHVRDLHAFSASAARSSASVETRKYAHFVGLDRLGPDDGVHLVHSMGDTFALEQYLDSHQPESAIIAGAGYVGLEMAEALTIQGLQITQLRRGDLPVRNT